MWERWNQTTKIFEKSTNNGASWTPLGLDASIITQGVIDSARLPPYPPSSGGDVVGPAGATNDRVALYNGTTGKVIKNSNFAVDALGGLLPTGYVYPGRADIPGTLQGSWFLAGHGSYGFYTNTGIYVAGYIYGAIFADYTPAWTSTGTQPVLGNGTLTGRYTRYGPLCFCRIRLVAGSTTTFGTGQWQFSFPMNFAGAAGGAPLPGMGTDASTGQVFLATGRLDNAAKFSANYHPVAVALAAWTSSAPFVWAVGDILNWQFFYEIG